MTATPINTYTDGRFVYFMLDRKAFRFDPKWNDVEQLVRSRGASSWRRVPTSARKDALRTVARTIEVA